MRKRLVPPGNVISRNVGLMEKPKTDERWRDCRGTWDRLKWARKRKFETAKDAARALGEEPGTYRAYEREPGSSKWSNLDHQRAGQYAKAFKVNWIWLLNGGGTPFDGVLTAPQERILGVINSAPPDRQEAIADLVERLFKEAG